MLKNNHTLAILRCERGNIIKICLSIFQQYAY